MHEVVKSLQGESPCRLFCSVSDKGLGHCRFKIECAAFWHWQDWFFVCDISFVCLAQHENNGNPIKLGAISTRGWRFADLRCKFTPQIGRASCRKGVCKYGYI